MMKNVKCNVFGMELLILKMFTYLKFTTVQKLSFSD